MIIPGLSLLMSALRPSRLTSSAEHRFRRRDGSPVSVLPRASIRPGGWILHLILLGNVLTGFAQTTNSSTMNLPLSSSGSGVLAFVRVLGALALVLGLFFGGLWVARNWQRFTVRQGPAPKLSICEVKALGQRHTLYVVGYEQTRMLVAASPTGVNLLTQLPAASAEVAEVVSEPLPISRPNFGAFLLQAIGQKR